MNFFRKMKFGLGALLLTVLSAQAAFQVSEGSEEIAERGRVARYSIRSDAGNFGFNPPAGWAAKVNETEQRIDFVHEAAGAVLSVQFSTNRFPGRAEEFVASVRAQLFNAEVVERFEAVMRAARGNGAEFRYQSAGIEVYRTRVAAFQFGGGSVQIRLSAAEASFPRVQRVWTSFLNSFEEGAAKAR